MVATDTVSTLELSKLAAIVGGGWRGQAVPASTQVKKRSATCTCASLGVPIRPPGREVLLSASVCSDALHLCDDGLKRWLGTGPKGNHGARPSLGGSRFAASCCQLGSQCHHPHQRAGEGQVLEGQRVQTRE